MEPFGRKGVITLPNNVKESNVLNIQVYKPKSKSAEYTLIHPNPHKLAMALAKDLGTSMGKKAAEAVKPVEKALTEMKNGTLPADMIQMKVGDRRIRLKYVH